MARKVTPEEVQAVFATSPRMSDLVAALLAHELEVTRNLTGSCTLGYGPQGVTWQTDATPSLPREVSARVATMLHLLLAQEAEIERVPVGSCTFDYAHAQVKLTHQHPLQAAPP